MSEEFLLLAIYLLKTLFSLQISITQTKQPTCRKPLVIEPVSIHLLAHTSVKIITAFLLYCIVHIVEGNILIVLITSSFGWGMSQMTSTEPTPSKISAGTQPSMWWRWSVGFGKLHTLVRSRT